MQPGVDDLMQMAYDEMRAIAVQQMANERQDHTLQPTALIHEAYLRLAEQKKQKWKGATHFRAAAAVAMQRVLVDHARGKNAKKRGGSQRTVSLSWDVAPTENRLVDAESLTDVLEVLRGLDERQYRVMILSCYGGLTQSEIAEVLDVSERTVRQEYRMGRAWLGRELSPE